MGFILWAPAFRVLVVEAYMSEKKIICKDFGKNQSHRLREAGPLYHLIYLFN